MSAPDEPWRTNSTTITGALADPVPRYEGDHYEHPARRTAAAHAVAAPPLRRVTLHRWPSALGLSLAVLLLATGAANRETLAIAVTAAAVCYLAAAALGRPWVAWASIIGASLVIVASELVGLTWWAGLGLTGLD